ncbi:MAG TPA: VWA domain-containing protein [Pyrinomonadaceae bacterium]|nr:VWA domain-containing protein [Pyrinomonadaceae bacterium]
MSPLRFFQRVFPFCARGTHLISCLILFVCFSASAASVVAQEIPPKDDEVLRVTTDLLLFPARVRDKNGNRPDGLTEKDLSLKDPDAVTSGLYFSPGVDRVAMVFALDQSGSVRDIISKQRDAAAGLYRRFNSLSSIAVLHFSHRPAVAAPFVRDVSSALGAFDVRAHDNQPTAIFDAAAHAVQMFKTLPPIRSERRIVILISDGLDNFSRAKPDSVISAARADRVSFYIIHLPLFEPRDGRLAVRRAASGFRDLAEKTGGKYFLANDSPLARRTTVDLTPIFEAIEADLKSQYLIGFYLNEKANDGRRHTFSLSMPPGLEYQFTPLGYSRTHKFFVERPREALKPRS